MPTSRNTALDRVRALLEGPAETVDGFLDLLAPRTRPARRPASPSA